MDISKMSDQEKSVMLAKAMGWGVNREGDHGSYDLWIEDILILQRVEYAKIGMLDSVLLNKHMPSLYAPANMALAWKVAQWGHTLPEYTQWMLEPNRLGTWFNFTRMPPAEAQRLWLDKILELAIEAGMIEEE